MKKGVLSLDIGGTNIRSGIVVGTKIFDFKKIKTPKKRKDILKTIEQVINSYPRQKAICIACAGFENKYGIQLALNIDIGGLFLSKIISKKFKTKVYIENDADCAALAELHYGAGKGMKNFVLLTLGTGIGGAIIIDGKLYNGEGGGGEPGSMIIDKENIFEHFASGNASVDIARKKFGMKDISSLELEEKANRGEKKAKEVYEMVGHYLGIGLANLSYILDPEVFIIGGGFSRVKHIYAPAKKALNKLYLPKPKPKIIKAKFGDDAGLIGAALLPLEKKK